MAIFGTLGEIDQGAISASITDTAVDVFVYDTRKDSDGGAWRKRTQHTSWYNETLNTSTRGSRKEFPAVAVIVAETSKVTIYDGDDPDMPMWMVFNATAARSFIGYQSAYVDNIKALNASLVVGATSELNEINFLRDDSFRIGSTASWYTTNNISQRNVNFTSFTDDGRRTVSNGDYYVAMTVLPNAPIDPSTGLSIPTIAVATDGGVSVIKDDGTVFDITADAGSSYNNSDFISISSDGFLVFPQHGGSATTGEYSLMTIPIPTSDRTTKTNSGLTQDKYIFNDPSPNITAVLPRGLGGAQNGVVRIPGTQFLNYPNGLAILDENPSSVSNAMVAYIKSNHNTGWMHGDIKGAFLSDTTAESLTINTNLASTFTQIGTARLTSETYDDGDTSWQMVDDSGSVNGYVMFAMPNLTVGQTYFISMTWNNNAVTDNSAYGQKIVHQNGLSGQNDTEFTHWNKNNGSSETLTGSFTAQTTNDDVLLIYANAITLNVSNFIVRAVDDEDRSVNNNGLAVFGTITKTPVATGADLVGYSGWSSSNYLRQPYNSDLDFGTGNWCYMFWYNPNDAESGDVIFSRWSYNVDGNNYPRIQAYFNSGNLRVDTNDTASGGNYQGHVGSDGTQDSNEWNCAVILRRGPNLEIWINGVNYSNDALNSSSSGSYTDTNAILEIGHSPGAGSAEAGLELALFRISASTPSPEQIKKIYEDEKVLFQENSKATLYGSSDAVTALAYDDTTNLLHVGTSAGRSEFQGLRRINNTTDAVTTAISASNGLVAEQ